ncbi:class I SAM-dependent methyltransferase family protein [Candidatus Bathyarchaeota archaeon]|nr:class I SAM-dependent methyltransferase family protein [Candidatus Bathyarchaeota archaeon]NIU81071.1 class I SAM-dependent methyltransferase family protein [Candidatus Bathyarchaeota archaeon]NIV68149.1 class I SAM-dependent methyltransferase family protein [Candidatus Bathyarchaeota archaeon]NIW16522.1 class I SAM-dependent methyltransferase family protein [Candidatus Bathyarchaeota archaeon]NIW34664.1 class I SAM-dependent methyltransferase family protein [Candidatus Bathyarchaeota archae
MGKDLKTVLSDQLEPWEIQLLYRAYDIIGDIAVIRIPEALEHRSRIIAEAVMETQKRVKTVLRQVSPVSGEFRLRELEWVAGEKKTETVHKEYGCLFKVDVEQCYFSPRLSYERRRISQQVKAGEVVVNMFSGVGCYSIVIAKHSQAEKIYSIDVSPVAVRYMRENVGLNKVAGQVVPLEGDAKSVIMDRLQEIADRVLMPLPERAYEYLDYAVQTLKPTGGWIHYYDFQHAKKEENPVDNVKVKLIGKLQELTSYFEFSIGRTVRTIGPNWYQVVLDLRVQK